MNFKIYNQPGAVVRLTREDMCDLARLLAKAGYEVKISKMFPPGKTQGSKIDCVEATEGGK